MSGGPAHALVAPALRSMSAAVRATAARVVASGAPLPQQDDDAVHDFRVALRRLRTVLRPLRVLYGDRRMRAVADELARYGDATGGLRDGEVLRETLAELALDDATREAATSWLAGRDEQERQRRRDVVRLLAGDGGSGAEAGGAAGPASIAIRLDAALDRLERRLVRADQAGGEDALTSNDLARTAIDRCLADIDEHVGAKMTDGVAMHALRIRFKRLRYTAELLREVLGDEAEPTIKAATRMQKRLGELHDIDEAILRVSRSKSLEARALGDLVRALRVARSGAAQRATADLAVTLATWPAPRGGRPKPR